CEIDHRHVVRRTVGGVQLALDGVEHHAPGTHTNLNNNTQHSPAHNIDHADHPATPIAYVQYLAVDNKDQPHRPRPQPAKRADVDSADHAVALRIDDHDARTVLRRDIGAPPVA